MTQSVTPPSALSALVDSTRPAALRPTNVARSVFHVCSGMLALFMIRAMPTHGWLIFAASAFAASAWSMEISRKTIRGVNEKLMKVFGPVAHPDEWHRVNSATWYATALVLLAIFATKEASEVGVITLAVADPIAAIVGRRFGSIRLVGKKSLEGSLGFVAAGTIACFAWLACASSIHLFEALVVAATGAMAGAVAELLSTRFDDNFTIPVTCAGAITLLRLAIGG